jgi:hypothetical protein
MEQPIILRTHLSDDETVAKMGRPIWPLIGRFVTNLSDLFASSRIC